MEEHHNQKQCDSHHGLEWRLQATGAARLISKSNACIKNAALLSPTDDPPLPEKRLWTESQPGEGRSEAWREKGGSGVRLRLRRGGTLSLPSGTEGP